MKNALRASATTLLLFAVGSLAADTLHESFDHTYAVSGSIASFALTNVNGRITISSWDQPQIRVQAQKTVKARSAEAAKDALAAVRIEVTQSAGGVRVVTRVPRNGESVLGMLFGDNVDHTVEYQITVPTRTKLAVENTNGELSISAVNGEFNLETTNGRIELVHCSGQVDAETTNGRIRAELGSVSGPLHLETTNGSITLVVPPSFSGVLDAATTNGTIDTDLPVATRGVRDNSLEGTIGAGGPAVRLRTTNGRIELRSAAQASSR